MTFDFYQQYKDYSNIELLKIIKRPGEYQPDAVTIATQILSERNVTPDEIQSADNYYEGIDNTIKARKEKIDSYKTVATDFLEPILHPAEKVEPQKWLNILLFVVAIQYVWDLFITVKQLIRFFKCYYCHPDILFFAENLTLIYVPFIFFLLYKRKRWGWILLFADNLFVLMSGLGQFYIFFKYQSIHHGNTGSFLFPIFIKAAFVFFLWRNSIANHFGVSHETKNTTAVVITILSLFFILIMNLL